MFQLTAARRRLAEDVLNTTIDQLVSTHSRPKAAGPSTCTTGTWYVRFNSQPPEGGWVQSVRQAQWRQGFNSQPPEGGWSERVYHGAEHRQFQLTAARRRLVGLGTVGWHSYLQFQLTAARRRLAEKTVVVQYTKVVSTHSRPKAAGTRRYKDVQ